MVRIIPTRLLSSSSNLRPSAPSRSSSSSSNNSDSRPNKSTLYSGNADSQRRKYAPVAMRSKGDSVSPVRDAGNGLALKVVIMRVGSPDLFLCCLITNTPRHETWLQRIVEAPQTL